ncbi:hypothetical protein [Pseudomonas bohemica]|uniref:hypothetical protein n=1 Tax=Pseudomonas bohemica TaxID=2044872 RepID=UPI000DA628A9|nr:hypothetical protein [Pseudomonas bohemica]
MNDMNVREPIPLPPAVVPSAYADGLLKTADLNAPIPVEVEVWPAAETGYTVRLDLDGVPVTAERVIKESDKPGDILILNLSESHLRNEGTYILQYRIYSPNTEAWVMSPSVPLKVDLTSPGATLLAPLIFPSATFDDRLTGLLPGYYGMQPGDTIQTFCNGFPGPTYTVQPEDLTIRPIEIVFEREALQSFATQTAVIDYSVTDRAGNQSIKSVPVTLTVTL